jgi:hypothetical protein
MSLLEDIQNAAVAANSDLGELLRKCKVLAARLDSKPLEDWLIWESNGYPKDVDLPNYRVWDLHLKGNFSGPFGSGLKHAPIPSICVPENIRDNVTVYKCRQSVASIQDLLSNDATTFQIPLGDVAVLLGDKVYDGNNCLQAWGEIGRGNVVEVVNAVRNRILDLVLAIGKEDPKAGEVPSSAEKLPASRVKQIFNTTVYGGASNIVGTAESSTISFNVQAGDFASLAQALERHEVDTADIRDLKTAVDAEPSPKTSGSLGPLVSGWLAKMFGKAASGAWNIGLAAAGRILAKLIAMYYGLPS